MKTKLALSALAVVLATPALAQMSDFRESSLMANAFEVRSGQIALEKSRNPRVREFAREMVRDHRAANVALLGGREGVASGAGIGGLVAAPFEIAGGAVGAATGAAAGAVSGTLQGGPVGGLEGVGAGAARGARAGADLAGADVTTTAATASVPLSPEQQAMLAELAQTPAGPRFDRTYGRIQVQAHRTAIGMTQAYLQAGPNPALRTYAEQVLPSMQEHLALAERLPGAR